MTETAPVVLSIIGHRVNYEARAAVRQYKVVSGPVILHQRIDHQHAFTQGLTAAECARS